MQAHYLQHVQFEGLGSIEPWLQHNGYTVTATRFFESSELPRPQDIDFLIVMGGPMSVNDENVYQWLSIEKQFIKSVIDLGKPVLGICLGAQLIASASGSTIYPNTHKEIGWYPIENTPVDEDYPFHFPSSVEVFHWHGETFNLPQGARRLAKSKACENQAFQIGSRVLGLQFHLETTPHSAWEIIENCREELIAAQYVQTEEEILAASKEKYSRINSLMTDILTYLTQS